MARPSHKTIENQIRDKASAYTYHISVSGSTYTAVGNNKTRISQGTDFTAVWDAVISDAAGNNTCIVFGEGTFSVDTELTFGQSNITIKGQGAGVTNIQASTSLPGSSELLKCMPANTGTSYLIDTSVTGATSVTTSTAAEAANITKDDYFVMYNDVPIPNEGANDFKAEILRCKVTGVVGTGKIDIYGYIEEGFNVSTTPNIIKLDPLYENITISDIAFTNARPGDGTGSPFAAVAFRYCKNVLIERCRFTKPLSIGLTFIQCLASKVSNCHFDGNITGSDTTDYGVQQHGGNGCLIENCSFDGRGVMRHAFTNGSTGPANDNEATLGYARGGVVRGCHIINTVSSGLDTHAGATMTTFSANTIQNCNSNGIFIRCPVNAVGNHISNISGHGINVTSSANGAGSIISNNTIRTVTDDGITMSQEGCTVTGNSIQDTTDDAITFTGTGKNYTVANNSTLNIGGSVFQGTRPVSDSDSILQYQDGGLLRSWMNSDDAGAGFTFENDDGGITLTDLTGSAGSCQPAITMNAAGDDAKACFIVGEIPVASDTGTTAAVIIVARQDDQTPLDVRSALRVRNGPTTLLDIDKDGRLGKAVFTDANRGTASAYAAGTEIWNSDDAAPNWSDGSVWKDAAGVNT